MQGAFRQVAKGRFGYDWVFKQAPWVGDWNSEEFKQVWADATRWCTAQYGPAMAEGNNGVWGIAFGLIVFDHQRDAALFKLTWC